MNARAILALGLCALLFYSFVAGFSGEVMCSVTDPVHNINTGLNYASIQEAIDAPETMNGNTILVDAGTYNTTLDVDKSLAIIGSGQSTTVIDGGGSGLVVDVQANGVLFEGFTVKDGNFGIYLDNSNGCVLLNNSVTDISAVSVEGVSIGWAIWAVYSESLTINQNNVGPNDCNGILVSNSYGFTVSNNYVHDNIGYGINANASSDGLITGNDAYGNSYDGIGLSQGSHDVNITGNNISNNVRFGVDVIDSDCVNNLIYDNNIVNNGLQASVPNASNSWDNGVEGNYWSDYQIIYLNASEIDSSGIWNTPYVLSANDADNYPLMGPFSVFATSLGLDVDVVSNSSIASFAYLLWNGTIMMDVSSTTAGQTFGFCRVRLPHGLMSAPYNVTVDGANPLYWNYTVYDDGVSRWIYFLYQGSVSEVVIRGRSPPATVSIISPENKTYTSSDVPLAFTVNEETSELLYSLDGHANMTVTGNTTLTSVSNGTHTLVLYAQNSFGDTNASGIVYFTVSVAGSGLLPFLLATVVAIIVILAVVLVYLRKLRKNRGKNG